MSQSLGFQLERLGRQYIVSSIQPNLSASRMNLNVGDVVESIDGVLLDDKTVEEIETLCRGIPGSPVVLGVFQRGNTAMKSIVLTRSQMDGYSVPRYKFLHSSSAAPHFVMSSSSSSTTTTTASPMSTTAVPSSSSAVMMSPVSTAKMNVSNSNTPSGILKNGNEIYSDHQQMMPSISFASPVSSTLTSPAIQDAINAASIRLQQPNLDERKYGADAVYAYPKLNDTVTRMPFTKEQLREADIRVVMSMLKISYDKAFRVLADAGDDPVVAVSRHQHLVNSNNNDYDLVHSPPPVHLRVTVPQKLTPLQIVAMERDLARAEVRVTGIIPKYATATLNASPVAVDNGSHLQSARDYSSYLARVDVGPRAKSPVHSNVSLPVSPTRGQIEHSELMSVVASSFLNSNIKTSMQSLDVSSIGYDLGVTTMFDDDEQQRGLSRRGDLLHTLALERENEDLRTTIAVLKREQEKRNLEMKRADESQQLRLSLESANKQIGELMRERDASVTFDVSPSRKQLETLKSISTYQPYASLNQTRSLDEEVSRLEGIITGLKRELSSIH